MTAARQLIPVDAYRLSRKECEGMFEELEALGALSHVDLGEQIRKAVARIAAAAYQGHLDKLFEQESRDVATWPRPLGSEVRERARDLETEFGRVTVRRHGLRLSGEAEARFPLDEALSLPAEMYAFPLRERVAKEASMASYERTVAHVADVTQGHVPKRQSEQLAIRAAVDFEDFYEQAVPPANDALAADAVLMLSVDGKGITMRPEALRGATRRDAEGSKASAVRGDPMAPRKARRHDKRMAVVTAVWEQDRFVRTAGDVLERLGKDPKGRARIPRNKAMPRPQNKRVAASVKDSHAVGVARMFDEAQRRNPNGERTTVVLVDGDEHQLENVQAEARKRKIPVIIVLDVIHVLHYLWTIAMAICRGNERDAEAWSSHTLEQLLTMSPMKVVGIIRRTATQRGLGGDDREALDRALEYLRKNCVYIHYAIFLAKGFPIASGVIEGACRHLVQDRMGITGARWGLDGAEAILKLRALRVSGHWPAYWAFHLRREHLRNYAAAVPDPDRVR
jgi:hypothetical protein